MLKIKLFAVAAFLAFAACALLFSNDQSHAQSSEKRDEILEKIAGYKGWKQIQKPAKESELSILKSDEPTVIINSAAMG